MSNSQKDDESVGNVHLTAEQKEDESVGNVHLTAEEEEKEYQRIKKIAKQKYPLWTTFKTALNNHPFSYYVPRKIKKEYYENLAKGGKSRKSRKYRKSKKNNRKHKRRTHKR